MPACCVNHVYGKMHFYCAIGMYVEVEAVVVNLMAKKNAVDAATLFTTAVGTSHHLASTVCPPLLIHWHDHVLHEHWLFMKQDVSLCMKMKVIFSPFQIDAAVSGQNDEWQPFQRRVQGGR